MPRITIPQMPSRAQSEEAYRSAQTTKEQVTDPNRWRALGSAWKERLMDPINVADRTGQHMRDLAAGRVAEPNPLLATEAAMAAQGAAHTFGAGSGSAVASIGRRQAIKRVRKDLADFEADPRNTSLDKMIARETADSLESQVGQMPQEALDPIGDIRMTRIPQAKEGVFAKGTTRARVRESDLGVEIDPTLSDTSSLPHEISHVGQLAPAASGLDKRNQFTSEVLMDIRKSLIAKVRSGKATREEYDKLYEMKQLPHETHAGEFGPAVSEAAFFRAQRGAEPMSVKEYNSVYGQTMKPTLEALKRTAPKTFSKAVKSASATMAKRHGKQWYMKRNVPGYPDA